MRPFLFAGAALLVAACQQQAVTGAQPVTGAVPVAAVVPVPINVGEGARVRPNVGDVLVAGYPALARATRNPNCAFLPNPTAPNMSLELPGRRALFIDVSGTGACNPVGGAAGTIPLVVSEVLRLGDGSVVAARGDGRCILRPNGNHTCE